MENAFDRNKLCYLYDVEGANDEQLSSQEIPDNIYDYKNLHISTLAMDFPATISKKHRAELEKNWIQILPTLDNITTLSVRHRVNQEYFEAICKMKNLKTLFFWTSTVEDIRSISKLKNISSLSLNSFSKLKDVTPLKSLKKLRRLSVENCFSIENYDVIGDLTALTGLCIGGNFSAPKNLILESLMPFSSLNSLKHLDMSTASIRDKSYHVILKMDNLERLDAHWRMPDDKRTALKQNHPNLKAGFFVDYDFVKNEFYEGKEW